jgi:hypothetical protein
MAARRRKPGVTAAVLDRAASLVKEAPKPVPPAAPSRVKLLPREKVLAALKKLHPMD